MKMDDKTFKEEEIDNIKRATYAIKALSREIKCSGLTEDQIKDIIEGQKLKKEVEQMRRDLFYLKKQVSEIERIKEFIGMDQLS